MKQRRDKPCTNGGFYYEKLEKKIAAFQIEIKFQI